MVIQLSSLVSLCSFSIWISGSDRRSGVFKRWTTSTDEILSQIWPLYYGNSQVNSYCGWVSRYRSNSGFRLEKKCSSSVFLLIHFWVFIKVAIMHRSNLHKREVLILPRSILSQSSSLSGTISASINGLTPILMLKCLSSTSCNQVNASSFPALRSYRVWSKSRPLVF